jgi:hypothetical protein
MNHVGARVRAAEDIGGYGDPFVPKGTPGEVVAERTFWTHLRVRFEVPGNWFELDVEPNQVR